MFKPGDREAILDDLAFELQWKHPNYTVNDVKPIKTPGYLECTKPCHCNYPPFDGHTIGFKSGTAEGHYHSIYIGGYRRGYGRGMYAFWKAVCAVLGKADSREVKEG